MKRRIRPQILLASIARRPARCLWFWLCLTLLLAGLAGPLAAQQPTVPEVAWQRKTGLIAAPDPCAADINMDHRLEVIQAGVTNTVTATDAASGRLIWRQDLGNHKLMTPVAGHFLGNGRINLAVGSVDGTIFILDGPTGKLIKSYDCGFVLMMPPTVFPWTAEDPSTPYREGLILYDPARRLLGVLLNPSLGMDQVFQIETHGLLTGPPVVGHTGLDAPAPHISFINYDGEVNVFSGRKPAACLTNHFENTGKCQKGLILGDLNGDGAADLVAVDTAGMIHAYTVRAGQLVPLWAPLPLGSAPVTYRTVLREPEYNPVTIDANGDHRDDILLIDTDSIMLLDGADGLSLWGDKKSAPSAYAHDRRIESSPAVFHSASGKAYAIFCDGLGVNLLPLFPRTTATRLDLGRSCAVTPLIARYGAATNEAGPAAALAFVRTTTDGYAYLLRLGLNMAPEEPPWLGWRGGPWRQAGDGREYYAYEQAQMSRLGAALEQTIQQAQALAAGKHWREALDLVTQVLEKNPSHAQARSLVHYYFLRANITWLAVAALALLALLLYLGRLAWRRGRAALDKRNALRAIEQQRYDRAIRLLHGLCYRYPRNRSFAARLADLYIQQKLFTAESAAIFARARQFYPGEDRYLKALATAYSSIPRHDEAAAGVYHEMTKVMKKPGPWFFLLGQTLLQLGRAREALDAFRQTVVQGHEDPRLPQYMTDLYIQLGIHTPEILPTLDRMREERQGDRAFLRIYCQACQEARRYDDEAWQTATRLLEQDPAAPCAHIIIATRQLQAGQYKDAMLHAEQVLEVNPNDPAGLRLLGASYAAEHRIDATAMTIFTKALEANPDAPELLIAVSHGYAQEDRQDPAARDLYTRALVHNPQDEIILQQLARIAAQEGDDDLAIRAIEPLLALGRHGREFILQLADAYCRLGITEDKVEPIYREALVSQPNHATIQDNLAVIYLRQGRSDAEAAQIYAAALERNPQRFDIGLQLMRCYQEAELPEKAIELGRRLQELEPENADLKKLIAGSSERANQMESAIATYEQVLAEDPEDQEAICALSSLYGRKRLDDNRAIEIFNKAIQLEPERPDHYLAAARAYAARDSWDHALQTVKHLLTRAPGQLSTAIGLLETLVDSAPRNNRLRWYLVDSLIFDNRLREARQHIVEMLRLDPAQAETALIALDRILEKNAKDAPTHLERGRVLLALGREADARQAMEQAHRYQLDNDEIVRELMDLYQRILEKRDSTEVRFQRGRLAMQLEKWDLAISCFQITHRDYRWEAESLRNLAHCFMAKGMLDLALQELRRLPLEDDIKEQLYELGQRYEAVHDVHGAREVYKIIFAADITFRDIKGKLESLVENGERGGAERTAILSSLSDEAKRRYELVQELGRGAMGIVYKARDNELDEYVALKILPDNMIRNSEAIKRFRQEARNARRLAHPNIVRIHDIGEEMGRKYISMEFVQGTDLKQKLRQLRRQIPFPAVLKYARQICAAMAYAHDQGIVHRDIKPANLMITQDDQIKVTDFGIAKMVESTATQNETTHAGAIIGTPLYMSPEQVKGQVVDHRADIYSMGVVFYEMAGGNPPFTEGDLAYQHLFVEPKPLTNVPEAFAQIVMKCLAKDKQNRWQSVQQILDELNQMNGD